MCTIVLFFFSSRRRHTRWPRDWSSDVCSSDLGISGRADGRLAVNLSARPVHMAIEAFNTRARLDGLDAELATKQPEIGRASWRESEKREVIDEAGITRRNQTILIREYKG